MTNNPNNLNEPIGMIYVQILNKTMV